MGARVYNGLGCAVGALLRVPVARWVLCVPRAVIGSPQEVITPKMTAHMTSTAYMDRAIELATAARLHTSPNPWVG